MTTCLVCDSSHTSIVYKSHNQPLGRYGFAKTRDQAKEQVADLTLEIRECKECGFAWNQAFDAAKVDYSSLPVLEASAHSPDYHLYQTDTARWLESFLDKKPTAALEIGGGSGFFISQLSIKDKTLYEPSLEAATLSSGVKHIRKYFDPFSDKPNADLIIMRQVLEHISYPLDFVNGLVRAFREGPELPTLHLYIEVPSHEKTTEEKRFADFYYEHCNYFTLNSLALLAAKSGGRVCNLVADYNSEINRAVIKYDYKCKSTEVYVSALTNLVKAIESIINMDGEIAFWGASGNGIMLLNSIGKISGQIAYVIDSDSRKHGLFIPVTGQEIVPPSDSRIKGVKAIVIASQFHVNEIASTARSQFGGNVVLFNAVGDKL